jgi:parallel beta-helix repeat protein
MAPIPSTITTDRATARIIVGNLVNGDVASDCDYLDTGNGAQLALAIAAAGAGDDVYVRPGVYDFVLVGGPSGAIAIPDQVHVRGAGRGHTFIRTRGQGDQGAFDLGDRSELDDLTVEVTLPTGIPVSRYGVVELWGPYSEVRRVNVDFLGVWTSVEAANFEPVACFFVMSGSSKGKIIDCGCGLFGEGAMPSMWTLTSGSQALYAVMTDGSPSSVGCDVVRLKTDGGDGGVRAVKMVRVRDAEISNPLLVGIELLGFEADGSEVTGCLIEMFAAASGRYGIYLYTVEQCDVEGNRIVAWTGHSGARGIMLVDADENIVAKNRLPDNWGAGIDLDEDSDNNTVSLNNMRLCYLLNAGTGNEVAHNINADLPID